MPSGTQQEQTERALEESSAVFSGEVVMIDRPSPFKSSADLEMDTFRVSEVWKGPEQRTLEVHTALMGMSCGYPFKEGQEYLVYAYTGKQVLEVDLCNGTQRLTEAEAALRVLGDGETVGDGGDTLSDTSGGFRRLDVIGILGLAVAAAAALVVLRRLVRSV